MKTIWLPLLLTMLWACTQNETNTTDQSVDSSDSASTGFDVIAFGSCAHQDNDTSLWEDIAAQQPDLWVWLGDNIYGDTENMDTLRAKYARAKSKPGYRQLIANVPVAGIWDDHDFGVNDGGKEYPKKDSSKLLMLDFLDVPADAPVRDHKGAYQAYTYGEGEQTVQLILLDTRYFRDTLKRTPRGSEQRYYPNETGDILGEAQWTWLEEQLATSDAALTIIGSSIQVLNPDQGFEKWANFPQAHQRLYDLIVKTQPNNVLLLSGDRHIGELAQIELEGYAKPIVEFTSSGLTHTWSRDFGEENPYRIGDSYHMQLNYGLIRIDWAHQEVHLELRGNGGAVWQQHTVKL